MSYVSSYLRDMTFDNEYMSCTLTSISKQAALSGCESALPLDEEEQNKFTSPWRLLPTLKEFLFALMCTIFLLSLNLEI